jgi:hypothetical protein
MNQLKTLGKGIIFSSLHYFLGAYQSREIKNEAWSFVIFKTYLHSQQMSTWRIKETMAIYVPHSRWSG